jgi:hypothetical protein
MRNFVTTRNVLAALACAPMAACALIDSAGSPEAEEIMLLESPYYGFALYDGHLYVPDGTDGTILKIPVGGGGVEEIASGLDFDEGSQRETAVAPPYLYFRIGTDKLRRVALAGGPVENALGTEDAYELSSIGEVAYVCARQTEVPFGNNIVRFAEGQSTTISVADGSNCRTIIGATPTHLITDVLYRLPFDGGEAEGPIAEISSKCNPQNNARLLRYVEQDAVIFFDEIDVDGSAIEIRRARFGGSGSSIIATVEADFASCPGSISADATRLYFELEDHLFAVDRSTGELDEVGVAPKNTSVGDIANDDEFIYFLAGGGVYRLKKP